MSLLLHPDCKEQPDCGFAPASLPPAPQALLDMEWQQLCLNRTCSCLKAWVRP